MKEELAVILRLEQAFRSAKNNPERYKARTLLNRFLRAYHTLTSANLAPEQKLADYLTRRTALSLRLKKLLAISLSRYALRDQKDKPFLKGLDVAESYVRGQTSKTNLIKARRAMLSAAKAAGMGTIKSDPGFTVGDRWIREESITAKHAKAARKLWAILSAITAANLALLDEEKYRDASLPDDLGRSAEMYADQATVSGWSVFGRSVCMPSLSEQNTALAKFKAQQLVRLIVEMPEDLLATKHSFRREWR